MVENMNKLLAGKVAVVTGGVRGIGFAISKAFAEAGADLIVTTTRNTDDSAAAVEQLQALGGKVKIVAVNVADKQAVVDILQPAIQEFGGLDVLVNNAGITRDGLLLRMSEKAWDDVMSVDLKAAFNTIQTALPFFLKRKGGSIINISSVVGQGGNPGQCNYAAAKAGLIGFSKSLAKEMGPKNIRTNCIAPGYILTEMTEFMPEAMVTDYVGRIALRRPGKPEEVAQVALFLASEMSSYINAQVISCCGGMNK